MFITPTSAVAKPNEIELHIEATVQAAPDRVILPLEVIGTGESDAGAKADLQKNEAELMDGLSKLGIDQGKVRPAERDTNGAGLIEFFDVAEDCAAGSAAAEAAAAVGDAGARKSSKRRNAAAQGAMDAAACAASPAVTVRKTLLVEVSDFSLIPEISAQAGAASSSGRVRPVYSQSDPIAARKKARDQAIAKARAEAEGYAEVLGHKVVRIARVSNARPSINLQDVVTFFIGIDDRSNRMQPSWFASNIIESVAIDFVLAPK
ncbi:MAG: SIMPL domain-containing protein [Novosphingobium sp.]